MPDSHSTPLALRRLRSITGLVIGVFVTLHLGNHALGLISVEAQEWARPWIMGFWHAPPGQFLLYGSLIAHAALGLAGLYGRRHFHLPAWEAIQLGLGLAIPYLLLGHVVNTRGTRVLTGIDITYPYEIANLWIDPWIRARQGLLVLLVCGHFVVGLHYWWRLKSWYRHAFPWLLVAYVLLPAAALLGFAEAGMALSTFARGHPAWWQMMHTHGVPADAGAAHWRDMLKQSVGPGWLALVSAVFLSTLIRNRLARGRRFSVQYPEGPAVVAPVGMSVLEVSRMARRAHASVCGGRGRCTTCRVRVEAPSGRLPAPGEIEALALARIDAPPGLRLACQLRPRHSVVVQPIVQAHDVLHTPGQKAPEFGEERVVTVLFLDMRGSTRLAEERLPFDVVYLMSRYFGEMAEAVEQAGGYYSNFTGDGLMALFGLRSEPAESARAALACALDMLQRLDRLNEQLADEMASPLAVGIGIHTGEAIVGPMGPPKSPIVTALGDTVNTAARLESMTKEWQLPVAVSQATLQHTGLPFTVPLRDALLRGRSHPLRVAALDLDTLALCVLSEA